MHVIVTYIKRNFSNYLIFGKVWFKMKNIATDKKTISLRKSRSVNYNNTILITMF